MLTLLDQVKQTRLRRNAVLHSVWPNPRLDAAFGSRTVRPKNGAQPPTNRAAFQQLVVELVHQLDRIDQLQQWGHTEKAARQRSTDSV